MFPNLFQNALLLQKNEELGFSNAWLMKALNSSIFLTHSGPWERSTCQTPGFGQCAKSLDLHICIRIWYLFFSFWLTSFCMRSLSPGGEEGEGEMHGEHNMQIYNSICKIDSQWEFPIWLRELKQGLCNNLDGWEGEGDGREVQERGDVCIPMADS